VETLDDTWGHILTALNYELLTLGEYALTPKVILLAIAIIVITRLVVAVVRGYILKPFASRREIDVGRSYAIEQIVTYIIYIIGVASAFSIIGIEFSVLWAGAAALLVGVGLGLQQTFMDFFGGLLLLIEGPIEVGNVVEVDGIIGRVVEIGLRTCKIRTRNDIMMIVPNSHFVNESIINWSHIRSPLRFNVKVGVAYGSDVDLVTRTLEKAASDHPDVLQRPVSRVMFTDFGDSSLNFELYFYSTEHWRIEFVKSDLRFTIDRLFREQNIQIPFPQRDLWLRSPVQINQPEQADAAGNGHHPSPREQQRGPEKTAAGTTSSGDRA